MGGEKVIEGSKTGLPWGMLGEENADDKSMNWDDLDSTDFRERNSFQKEMADSDFVKPMVSSFSRMSPIQQVKVLPSIYYAADDSMLTPTSLAEKMSKKCGKAG